jgi:hypothetical protein
MTREELYGQFGPAMIEALLAWLVGEINTIRNKAALPPVTIEDAERRVSDRLQLLAPYEWKDKR